MSEFRSNNASYNAYIVNPLSALRVFALMLVFLLHSYIFRSYAGFEIDGGLDFILKTPAWAGVWIFFIVSGYLAGMGFFERRYEYSITGLVRYYLVKVVRILIPTLFFIFLICLLTAPEFLVDHPEVVKDILLLKYDGSVAFDGLGATWFIFTLFWLYLIAPFVCIAFDLIGRFLKNKSRWFVLLATVIIIGFWARNALYDPFSWSEGMYKSPLFNLDLFVAGILLNKIVLELRELKKWSSLEKNLQIISIILIVIVFVTNCYIYAWGEIDNPDYIKLYQIVYPTIWLIAISIYIVAYSEKSRFRASLPSAKTVIKHPKLIIESLATISFEFYLWHSLILSKMEVYVPDVSPLFNYLSMIVLTFAVTSAIAYVYHCGFKHFIDELIKKIKRINISLNR